MVTGSNPVSGATFFDTPQTTINTTLTKLLASQYSNYDTIDKKYDTTPLRLYKVDKTFYYRRRIKQKLFRISLKTKNIKVALKRRRTLDLIDGEEMFQIDTGDFKLMFEYDTEEELRTALETAKEIQIQAQLQRFKEVKEHIQSSEANTNDITFELLRDKFIARKKSDNRVSADSIGAYNTTFKMLISFFKDSLIDSLTVEDFEAFKDFKVNQKTSSNRTINKHLTYTRNFLQFAVDRHYITYNNAKPVTPLDEVKDKQERKKQVENYSQSDIKTILEFEYADAIVDLIAC